MSVDYANLAQRLRAALNQDDKRTVEQIAAEAIQRGGADSFRLWSALLEGEPGYSVASPRITEIRRAFYVKHERNGPFVRFLGSIGHYFLGSPVPSEFVKFLEKSQIPKKGQLLLPEAGITITSTPTADAVTKKKVDEFSLSVNGETFKTFDREQVMFALYRYNGNRDAAMLSTHTNIARFVTLFRALKVCAFLGTTIAGGRGNLNGSLGSLRDIPFVPFPGLNGQLYLPLTAEITDIQLEERAKERIAKIVFDGTWSEFYGSTGVAVALIGRDETQKVWMHYVPPSFADKSIEECDRWLSRAEKGVTLITSSSWVSKPKS